MTIDCIGVGGRYGSMTQVGPEFSIPKPGRGSYTYAVCLCSGCGNYACVHIKHLRSAATKGRNGCNRCRTSKKSLRRLKEYGVWDGMISRCHRSSSKKYEYYGGRGIAVCRRWRRGEQGMSGFECFYKDMGPRPGGAFTLERKDNSKGYSPSNCIWADRATNARNTRRNVSVTYKGKTQCLMDWSHELGIHPATLGRRHRLGWPVEQLLSPPRKRGAKGASQ